MSHTPDYFARMADGSAVVVDVRPAARVGPRDKLKFDATAAACEKVEGWSFRLVHEIEPVLAANVRWLSGYRHPRYADPGLGPLLRQEFTAGASLLEGVSRVADPVCGLPALFHLLWTESWPPTCASRWAAGPGSAAGSRRERPSSQGCLPGG